MRDGIGAVRETGNFSTSGGHIVLPVFVLYIHVVLDVSSL